METCSGLWAGQAVSPTFSNTQELSWIFIGRTDGEVETPILWPPDAKNRFIWEDPDAGKDWRQEETGRTEDEMVSWHHQLKGHEFEWTPGVDDGQGGLVCCGSWGRKESDTTEQLNWCFPPSASPPPFIWFVLSVSSFRKPKSFYICPTAVIIAWHLSVYFPLSCQRTLLEMVSIHLGHMPHS